MRDSSRPSTSGGTSYQRVGAQSSEREEWEDVQKRSRSQLALVSCVVLVLMAGAFMQLRDKLRGPVHGDNLDVGAPAVTGAPAAKDVDAPGPSGIEGIEKIGAGMMFVSDGEVLLLKRNSFHNHDKWGLPGGNVEDVDGDLLETAKREAIEEMGSLPPFELKGQIRTTRGKENQKLYTVFLAAVNPTDRTRYTPVLNEEHSAWAWIPLKDAFGREDLHPVVKRAFKKDKGHRSTVVAAATLAQDPDRRRV